MWDQCFVVMATFLQRILGHNHEVKTWSPAPPSSQPRSQVEKHIITVTSVMPLSRKVSSPYAEVSLLLLLGQPDLMRGFGKPCCQQ